MTLESSQRAALEAGRKVSEVVGRVLGRASREHPNPNAQRLVEQERQHGVDTAEAVAAREWARAATARAERGDARDTTDQLRKLTEDDRQRHYVAPRDLGH